MTFMSKLKWEQTVWGGYLGREVVHFNSFFFEEEEVVDEVFNG